FRNLLHHHVHRGSPGRASTFWSGIGAVKRNAFMDVEGFDEHYSRPSIEDIELGSRLLDNGAHIVLDPDIEGKHLKTWSLCRGGSMSSDASLRRAHRPRPGHRREASEDMVPPRHGRDGHPASGRAVDRAHPA